VLRAIPIGVDGVNGVDGIDGGVVGGGGGRFAWWCLLVVQGFVGVWIRVTCWPIGREERGLRIPCESTVMAIATHSE
jgi:hypothetical protein